MRGVLVAMHFALQSGPPMLDELGSATPLPVTECSRFPGF